MRAAVVVIALTILAGCQSGKDKKQQEGAGPQTGSEALVLDDPSCTSATACVADCDHGVVKACALASSIYAMGFRVERDAVAAARYRDRYKALAARACDGGDLRSCKAVGRAPAPEPAEKRCQDGDPPACDTIGQTEHAKQLVVEACKRGDHERCFAPDRLMTPEAWHEVRTRCAANDIQACMQCMVAMRGKDCAGSQ